MEKKTVTGEMKLKENHVVWYEPEKRRFGEDFLKNMGVAAALVLCAVTLKNGAVPPAQKATDAVLASVTDDTLLDDKLGKLSFVSKMFPEATLVFGESGDDGLAQPVSGGVVVHAWSLQEPYMAWRGTTGEVFSAGDGVVMGVYHGVDEERIVEVMSKSGISCVYGNLGHVMVQAGDSIAAGDMIGKVLTGGDCVFEIRENGVSVDPGAYLANVL